MVQEELRDGQQRPHPRRVPAEARVQGLQAGQGAVQEGGVLPAEHVQHQHGLHQALRGHGDTGTRGHGDAGWAWVEPGRPACPAHPALTAFCRSESPFLRAPAEGRRSPGLCQRHNSERGAHCSGGSRRGRGAIREQRAAPRGGRDIGTDAREGRGQLLSIARLPGVYVRNTKPPPREREAAPRAPRAAWDAAPGLTPGALLRQALAVLEGFLPQPLPRGQQAAGGGAGRQHGQRRALQLRPVVWRRQRGTRRAPRPARPGA